MSLADILTAHQKASAGMSAGTPDRCRCGAQVLYAPGDEDIIERRDRAFAIHQAEQIFSAASASNYWDGAA